MGGTDGSIRISTELETKSFDAQIAKLEADLQTMVKTLETDAQVDVKVRMTEQEKVQLQNDIEKTKNQILSLQERKNNLENEKSDFSNLKKGFEGLITSAKRLALGIIGVRSAFTLISRATSKYLQTDEKLSKKLEANWVALGQILAPIIEMIIGLIRKAVIAVLYFISLLTDTNYIQKANNAIMKQNADGMKKSTKNTKENTKALKENQKVLAGFDEMNIINDNRNEGSSNVGDTGVSSGFTPMPLFDLNELGPETRETIEKIAKVLKPVYNMIKKIIGWAIEHPDMIIAILGGVALLKLLKSIMGVANVSGLLGIKGVLLGLAAIGVISIIINLVNIKEAIDDANELNDNLRKTRGEHLESTKKQTKAIEDQIPAMKKNSKAVEKTTTELQKNINKQKNYSDVAMKNADNTSWLEKQADKLSGTYASQKEQIRDATEEEYLNLMALKKMHDQGKLNDKQTKEYAESLKDFKNRLGYARDESDSFIEAWLKSDDDLKRIEKIFEDTDNALYDIGQNGGIVSDTIATLNGKKINIKVEKSGIEKVIDKARDLKNNLSKLSNKTTKVNVELDMITKAKDFANKTMNIVISALTGKKIKLAQGGIVNNPGRGVPLGSNIIAGEAGPEAVLPLDEQNMAMLGRMIAQNMVVNLTNINSMNGRVISREIQRINAEQDFAYNR